MEEALKQLVTDTLDFSKRKFVGHSGEITVTMDTRALAPDHRIFYRNLHKFRVLQMNEGTDLSGLSDEQWGMVQLDKCHHISTTSTSKDGPQSYRVRICKTCCQEDSHIELGTYVDQESAILVNDTFEILNERLDRLIVLRIEDKPDLHHLVAKKYDRSKGRDYACILDLISERISAIEGKKRKPSVSEMIPTFTKRNVDNGSAVNSEKFSCSTSSEASDEIQTSTSKQSHSKTSSILSNSRPNSIRKPSRKLSFDADIVSNSGSSSTIDDDITVTDEITNNNNTTALLELSSVCYQRLISPSITGSIIPDSANLSPGMMTTGTSLFNGIAGSSSVDLARSLELVRSSSMSNLPPLSSTNTTTGSSTTLNLPMSTSSNRSVSSNTLNNISQITVAEGINLGSPFSANSATTTLLMAAAETSSPIVSGIPSPQLSPPNQLVSSGNQSPIVHITTGTTTDTTSMNTTTNSTNKRLRPDEIIDLPPSNNTNITNTTTTNQDNLSYSYLDGQTPRKRAATFSVSEPYAYYNSHMGNTAHNSIATLTWLASMEECEVDVARSLFELRGNKEESSNLFDNSGAGRSGGMGLGTDPLSLALGLGCGTASNYMGGQSMMECEEGEYYDYEDDDEEEEEELSQQQQQEGYYNLRRMTTTTATGGNSTAGSRNLTNSASKLMMNSQHMYGATASYQHTGQLFHQSASSHMNNLNNGVSFNGTALGQTRMRSSSMSMMDRGEAAWAILGNTGGYRSKMDPLSMALKKYHERGGSANAAASGFVGIYSPEDRKQRIERFLEKRKRRMWTKKVKYDVRKNFADSRVRVKGRFVKKQDEEAAEAAHFDRHNTSMNSLHSSCGSYDFQDEDDQMEEGDIVESGYDHTDVDLELLDQLNAQQQKAAGGGVSGSGSGRATTPSPRTLSSEVHLTGSSSNSSSKGLSLKLKISKPTPTTASGSGSRRERSNSVSKDAKVAELKLALSNAVTTTATGTTTGRRRRNSRVEDTEFTSISTTTAMENNTSSSTTTAGSRRNSISVSPSSAMTLKLERANLNSAVKPPPQE